MLRRKIAGALAAGLAAATLLTACGGDAADGPVTLKVLTWEPGGTEYWAQVKSTFEASHPDIRLDMEAVPFDRYPEVQGPYITSQSGPDVMANNAGLELFDRRGAYEPLGERAAEINKDLVTYSGACEGFDTTKPCYGVPFSYQGNVLYYNKSVLTAAGLDPENPPTTWDEFSAACEAVKNSGKTCLALGLSGTFPAYWDFPEIARNYLTEDDIRGLLAGTLSWTDPKLVATLEKLAEITTSGWTNSNAPSITMLPDGADIFQRGDAAFAGTIISDAVNWEAFGKALGDDNLGVTRWPVINPDAPLAQKFSGIEGAVYGVTKWSEKKQAGLEFISWLAGKENGELWVRYGKGQPLNSTVDKALLPTSPSFLKIQEFVAQPTLHAGVMLSGPETDALARGWQQVTLGQLTVDKWAEQMQQALERSPTKRQGR
ncbi:ABC transporter substrate-binding protein [Polymorphospora rubra]|uniref:Sugar-binding protein n=1 Tax=Polymorphospora rubra TaxID=338584 RepID=A0A810N643_9ACTN|nr:extracellular solute-binding protein [Polymorphospora rubra]BCJ68876.1 sugar-binding protein [Polymorphospora rubra]